MTTEPEPQRPDPLLDRIRLYGAEPAETLSARAPDKGTLQRGKEQADAVIQLLDLVQQYGAERENVGAATPARGELDREIANAAVREAAALLDRIAVLAPQYSVQARDSLGNLWWLHACGEVSEYRDREHPAIDDCPHRNGQPGTWRPLLVAAPDGDHTPEGWVTQNGVQTPVAEILLDMQRRETQIMKMVGVERPCDLLAAIADLRPHRTAAEIWAGLSDDERDGVASGIDSVPELTDALNREAGL